MGFFVKEEFAVKKRYYFIAAYVAVMTVLGMIVLYNTHVNSFDEPVSPLMDILLMISGGMAALLLLVILAWRIVKFILVKLGKHPDDYFVYRISAPKTLEHMIWTRSGRYREHEDRAEIEHSKRENTEQAGIEW